MKALLCEQNRGEFACPLMQFVGRAVGAGTLTVVVVGGPRHAVHVPSSAPAVETPAAPDLIAASAPVANQAASFALPVGRAPEAGLQIHTIWVARVA